YSLVLAEQRGVTTGGEEHPQVSAGRVWETIIKKPIQKEYKFDTEFSRALNEFSRKVAYFFHARLPGTASYAVTAQVLRAVAGPCLAQVCRADGQCFTSVQLQRGLAAQDPDACLDKLVPEELRILSCNVRARKPSERLFRQAVQTLADRGITPREVLHVGSRL